MKKLFISYSDTDKNKIKSFERLINSSNFFKPIIIVNNRGGLVQLTDKVRTGILQCDYFIPILTSNSINTQWINQEIGFATAASRKIIPIVENQIINSLKGFIHNQLNLSYSFDKNEINKKSESQKFSRTAKILINDLLLENNVKPKTITVESLFPGKWRMIYSHPQITGADEDVEIKEGNKYFVRGKHWFDLQNISVDLKKKKLKFKKVGIGDDPRKIFNDLSIIDLGKRYDGVENGDVKNIQVSYYKIL